MNPQNLMSTSLFEKESNAHQYLHKSSNHPNHVKDKIAYGLALRAKRVCSEKEEYSGQKQLIIHRLTQRGYKKNSL